MIVGCSRGCEAYSLSIEAELIGRSLLVTAVDFDEANIRHARSNSFHQADLIDFDGARLLTADVEKLFDIDGDSVRVNQDRLRSTLSFEHKSLFDVQGQFDLIVCNNVLIHFQHPDALRALSKLDGCLAAGGLLALGGVNIDLLSSVMKAKGFRPLLANVDEIWDGWKGDRMSWDRDPDLYVSMPPLDRGIPNWQYRFCTLFEKPRPGSFAIMRSWAAAAGARTRSAVRRAGAGPSP